MGLKTRTPFSINRNNMGKTCLNKLRGNVLVTCQIPSHGISDLYLMYADDVTFSVSEAMVIQTAAFVPGSKSYRVEGYKQNIQVTSAIRSTDVSNRMDISVMFKIPTSTGDTASNGLNIRSLLSGKFYVMFINNGGVAFFTGINSLLECSGFDYDSNSNGQMATVTLSFPDGSAGDYFWSLTDTSKNTIISKSA